MEGIERLRRVVAVVVISMMGWTIARASILAAEQGRPRSFGECLVHGGENGHVGADIGCWHIVSSTMRTYLTGTTACSEEVEYEIWAELRFGTVTWPFASRPTVTLPKTGATWPAVSGTPTPRVEGDR